MGYEEEPKDLNFTSPKLLLFSQRFDTPELQGGCSPAPHTIATVPFQWEEAPGKPRSTTTTDPPQKSKSFRSLRLPPKMFTSYTKVGIVSSPTNVLDGPYVGMHSSYSSPESMVSKSKWKMMMPLRKIMCKQTITSPVKSSSWSWDSFRDISSRRSSSSSFDTFSDSLDSKIKTNKVSKGRKLMVFDKTTSSILESMCASINQVVPWRR